MTVILGKYEQKIKVGILPRCSLSTNPSESRLAEFVNECRGRHSLLSQILLRQKYVPGWAGWEIWTTMGPD